MRPAPWTRHPDASGPAESGARSPGLGRRAGGVPRAALRRAGGAPGPAARPARPARPGAGGRRLAATFTALLAVLLVLLPAWPAPDARVAPGGQLPVHSVTAVPHPDAGFHDDDGCPGTCATQARPRHDHLGERPPVPEHLAVAAHGTGAVPAAHGRRTPAAPGSPAVSPGRTRHDRGRAPPAPSGT
ncbi:hypothetical protein ACWDTR_08275 [Streptomyces sp. NPDC003470]